MQSVAPFGISHEKPGKHASSSHSFSQQDGSVRKFNHNMESILVCSISSNVRYFNQFKCSNVQLVAATAKLAGQCSFCTGVVGSEIKKGK
jgi:hypothetical protein